MHTIFRTTSLYKQCLHVLVFKLLVSNFKAPGLRCISSIKANGAVLHSANGKNQKYKSVPSCDSYAFAIVAALSCRPLGDERMRKTHTL